VSDECLEGDKLPAGISCGVEPYLDLSASSDSKEPIVGTELGVGYFTLEVDPMQLDTSLKTDKLGITIYIDKESHLAVR
jgi:hypothetical protein